MFRFTHTARLGLRFASHKTPGYNAVMKLVPNDKKVVFVNNGVAQHGVEIKSLDVPKGKMIKILNVHPKPDSDPEVVVQIADQGAEANKSKEPKKKSKPAQIKNVQISWSISERDLLGQKKGAIESILSRGHVAVVQLKNKQRREPPPNANQIESREKLVKVLEDLLLNAGSQLKPRRGTVVTQMEYTFGPKKESEK